VKYGTMPSKISGARSKLLFRIKRFMILEFIMLPSLEILQSKVLAARDLLWRVKLTRMILDWTFAFPGSVSQVHWSTSTETQNLTIDVPLSLTTGF